MEASAEVQHPQYGARGVSFIGCCDDGRPLAAIMLSGDTAEADRQLAALFLALDAPPATLGVERPAIARTPGCCWVATEGVELEIGEPGTPHARVRVDWGPTSEVWRLEALLADAVWVGVAPAPVLEAFLADSSRIPRTPAVLLKVATG